MIRVPLKTAHALALVWGALLAATTKIPLPSWAHLVLIIVGAVLAGTRLIPEPASPPTTTEGTSEWE